MKRGPHHTQEILINPIGQPVEVDEQLADLLAHLWDRGYVTAYSCQSGDPSLSRDNPAPVSRLRYIMFHDIDDAERFQAEYGGHIDPTIYKQDRRCVRGFKIPTKEQLSHLN